MDTPKEPVEIANEKHADYKYTSLLCKNKGNEIYIKDIFPLSGLLELEKKIIICWFVMQS